MKKESKFKLVDNLFICATAGWSRYGKVSNRFLNIKDEDGSIREYLMQYAKHDGPANKGNQVFNIRTSSNATNCIFVEIDGEFIYFGFAWKEIPEEEIEKRKTKVSKKKVIG